MVSSVMLIADEECFMFICRRRSSRAEVDLSMPYSEPIVHPCLSFLNASPYLTFYYPLALPMMMFRRRARQCYLTFWSTSRPLPSPVPVSISCSRTNA